jgi:hypothetical protein
VQPAAPDDTEHSVLVEEVKVACTRAMLQCLDRPHRLAYILGELMDLSGPEAAEALGISAALFRKRLQHARQAILDFTRSHCGLVSDTAPCHCNRRVSPAMLANGEGAPLVQFACRSTSFAEARALVRQVDEARWASEAPRTSQPRASSVDFAHRLMDAFERARESGSPS